MLFLNKKNIQYIILFFLFCQTIPVSKVEVEQEVIESQKTAEILDKNIQSIENKKENVDYDSILNNLKFAKERLIKQNQIITSLVAELEKKKKENLELQKQIEEYKLEIEKKDIFISDYRKEKIKNKFFGFFGDIKTFIFGFIAGIVVYMFRGVFLNILKLFIRLP